jgi:hypothetical protein
MLSMGRGRCATQFHVFPRKGCDNTPNSRFKAPRRHEGTERDRAATDELLQTVTAPLDENADPAQPQLPAREGESIRR